MTAQAPPYRDATNEVANHAKRLLADRRETDLGKLGSIYCLRMARIAFGWVGILAALTALLFIATADEGQILALGLAWAAAFTAGIAGYVDAAIKFKRCRDRYERSASDPYAQVLRLTQAPKEDGEGPLSLSRVSELARDSLRLPLVVGALLLPVTLIVILMLVTGTRYEHLDEVARFALIFTVHVHIYAAIAAWRIPKKSRFAATIGIASMIGVLPFVISGFIVCIVATAVIFLYFLPITNMVERESEWIESEREERIDAKLLVPPVSASLNWPDGHHRAFRAVAVR